MPSFLILFSLLLTSVVQAAPGFAQELQQEANTINHRLQPWQNRAQKIQQRLDELYGLENPTFHPYQSPDLSLSFSPSMSYREKAADPFSIRTAVENDLSKQRYFDQPSFADNIPPRVQELELGAESVLQSQKGSHPYLRLTAVRIEARKRLTDPDLDEGTAFRGDYVNHEASIGNQLDFSETIVMRAELSYGVRTNHAFDPDEQQPSMDQRISDWSLSPDVTWKKSWGAFHVIPAFGITTLIDNTPGLTKGNHQTLGFQWDMAPRASDFVARIYELGFHRVESVTSAVTSITHQPYVSGHWKGLSSGRMDFSAGYQLLEGVLTDGSVSDSQQITVVPKSLPAPSPRWPALQEVVWSFPTRLTFGSSSDHRLNMGVGFESRVNVGGLRIRPSVTLDYDFYYESHWDEAGIHFGIGL